MHTRKFLLSTFVLAAMAAILLGKANDKPASGAAMVEAARNFLSVLSEGQRQKAFFAYDDAERLNWHFIPRERKGLPLRELHGKPLEAAKRFIASGLSAAGYGQALDVMSLEEVLYLLEIGDRDKRRERRDPRKYYLSVFGSPAARGTWGWRVEGHHLSLNYSVVEGEVAATTPEFFGANPATMDAGVGRRLRVLGPEEDLARQILKLCSPQQQKVAWVEKEAPRDVRGAGDAQPVVTQPVGLTVSKMSPDQKKLLGRLLNEYLQNMPADVERQRRARIESAGMENISFAWWGGSELNQPHYYRVQGPTFMIEFNNTQNNANHVHSMWRNLAGDFNLPRKNE